MKNLFFDMQKALDAGCGYYLDIDDLKTILSRYQKLSILRDTPRAYCQCENPIEICDMRGIRCLHCGKPLH